MRRSAIATVVALALLLSTGPSPTGAMAPPNDDLADATSVSSVYFEASPDMSDATLEPSESACDETGGLIDQSVWYAFTLPVAATMTVEINGVETGVTAAVYGPFVVPPTIVTDLPDATHCVYGTGADQALTEWYEPATYLVQLTTVSAWNVNPSIRIEQQPVRMNPWSGSYAIDAQAGVGMYIDWGWLACSRGLARLAPNAFDQQYELVRTDPVHASILDVPFAEARGYWGSVHRDDAVVDTCVIGPGRGWGVRWTYWLPPLDPGSYELSSGIFLRHTITDGADTLDGDGRPDLYRPEWMVLEEVITINVLAAD
jgi:hypothetical protein